MIKIYTTDWCPSCINTKKFFNSNNMAFEEIDIEKENMSRQDLAQITGGSSVPQIVINDLPIGGYSDLLALHQVGKLKDLLKV